MRGKIGISAWFRTSICCFAVILLITALPAPARAALIRGRLVLPNNAPAAGITVTVWRQDIGRSAPSVTDAGGMYYLNQIPPGVYWLEIWVSNPPRAYQITVAEPYTDIPPIIV
jgi:hypothetical protein